MIRTLRTLGVCLAAIAVVSGLTASAASAVEFHSESEKTTLTAKQVEQHVLTVPAGTAKCTTITYEGQITSKTTKTLTTTPTYSGCTLAGAAATIKMNGCTYTSLIEGKATVDCAAGQKIEVVAPTCTLTFNPQGPLSKLVYSNTGFGTTREVDITGNLEGIHVVQDGTKCLGNGGSAEKTFTTGKVTGTSLVTGEVTGGSTHTGIWSE